MGAGRVQLVEILVLALALFGALEMLVLLRWARPAAEQISGGQMTWAAAPTEYCASRLPVSSPPG